MKTRFEFREKELVLHSWALCNYGDHGDYEVFPSESMELDFIDSVVYLKKNGFEVNTNNEKVLFITIENTILTLYNTGRMVLENVVPDSDDAAIEMSLEIYRILSDTML